MTTKRQFEKLVTPKGTLRYPKLFTPDTKFKADGEYSTGLVLEPSDATSKFMEKLEAAHAASVSQAKQENKGKKIKPADMPWTDEVDEEGNSTGNIIVKAKLKALITPKNGEPFSQSPKVFDAKGQPIVHDCKPANGTIAKLNVEIVPFFTQLIGAGISLRLKAVQIIELIEWGGGSADSFGFEEEEGYAYSGSPRNQVASTSTTDSDDDDAEDYDDF